MDQKTRMLAAMDQKDVDRVPFSFWFHFSGEEAQGENCVQAHMAYYKKSGVDFMKIMSDGFGQPDSWEIHTASDWARIRPAGRKSAYFQGQLDRAKRIADALGGECCAFYNIFAPFSLMRQQAGDAPVMAHLKENEAAVLQGLDAIAEDAADLSRALITEAGLTGIYLALQGAERDRFTPEEYARIVAPSDIKVLSAANAVSAYNIAHLCGWAGDANNLEVWKAYPAKVFNWAIYIDGLSLVDGRAFFGGKTVMGGFDNRKTGMLYRNGTKAEIQAHAKDTVRAYVEAVGSNRGLILGADCTLPSDVDVERFSWVREALEEVAAG